MVRFVLAMAILAAVVSPIAAQQNRQYLEELPGIIPPEEVCSKMASTTEKQKECLKVIVAAQEKLRQQKLNPPATKLRTMTLERFCFESFFVNPDCAQFLGNY